MPQCNNCWAKGLERRVFVLSTVLPIFALILAGFGFARIRGIGQDAVALLNGFVVWLALPALLFDFVAEADWHALDQPVFVAVFSAGIVATFLLSLLLSPLVAGQHRPLARRALDALTSSYSNAAYIGIPLAHGLLGTIGLAAAVIASLLTVCALFAVAILLVEIDLERGRFSAKTLGRILWSVLKNPLVASPIAGALWAITGVPLPAIVSGFTKLLGSAATPVALVTIGMFLAQRQLKAGRGELVLALALKLAVQPILTAGLALALLPRGPWAAAAILLAALPTGTGPFMAAELYRQEVALASRATLLSTLLSVATISVLAWWLLG
jgi:predicted permease